jgi:hypothetical protein
VSDETRRAEALEAAGAPAAEQAEAWLAVAEAEPCFRWRAAPGRAALERAIAHMPVADRPDLDARAALRRAELELADDNLEAARALADLAAIAAGRAGQPTRALLARVVSARAALRDPELAAEAATELASVAAEVAAADAPDDRLLGTALGALLAVAFGEQLLVALDLDGAHRAYDRAETILGGAPAPALPDARFLALQGVALIAQVTRAYGRAADRLRAIVRLVNEHVSPRDELEARMALGHMLTQLGKHEDAVRHMDLARALAKEAAGVDERILAAQSAALAAVHGGSWGRALDRAFEALQLAGLEKRSLASYVAAVSLIAQIHLAREQPSEAYLALVYAAAALKQRLGPRAAVMIDAQIEELKRALGPEKFEAMCEDILRARAAREKLQPPE